MSLLFVYTRCFYILVQCTVIESLNRVTSLRAIIFAPTHNDAQFFACLAHLLFMLTVKVDYVGSGGDRDDEEKRFEDGCTQVTAAACHVWEELYMAKKQLLEEKFNTALVVEVNAARALCGEIASHHWQSFVDGEIRGTQRDLANLHQQIQSVCEYKLLVTFCLFILENSKSCKRSASIDESKRSNEFSIDAKQHSRSTNINESRTYVLFVEN